MPLAYEQVEEKEFFREATVRICGSLEIEKALWQCLLYIIRFMPADHMAFHVYHESLAMLETVAITNVEEGRALSLKTPLTPELSRQVRELHGEHVQVFDRWRDSDVAGLLMSSLGQTWGSGIILRLIVEGKLVGALAVCSYREREYTQEHARLLALLNDPFAIALANSLRYREVLDLKERLADDKQYLQEELCRAAGDEIIGADFGLGKVMEMVGHVAPLRSPVLLLGETGTGKELIAGAIHNSSPRKGGPLIKINCGALPSTLMDTELFGHEKGAFTGALSMKRGRFERAHEGSIFLDEVGELTPEAQVKLLRVLQEKEIERVGGISPIKVDIRVIAATHRNLEAMVREGSFREDLFFRLKVFPIVAQRVNAAYQLVELKDCTPGRIWCGVSTEFADQRTLRHLLQPQRGDDLIDVRLFVENDRQVDLSYRPDQALLVQRRIVGAVQLFQLVFQIGESRLETQSKPVQDGEVGLIDTVHVTGDRGRHDF